MKDKEEVKENKDKDSEMVKVEKEEITENKDKAEKTEKTTEEKKRYVFFLYPLMRQSKQKSSAFLVC